MSYLTSYQPSCQRRIFMTKKINWRLIEKSKEAVGTFWSLP